MANRNTKRARNHGFSDLARMSQGLSKNYGQKTGTLIDSSLLREKSGKKPYNPPKGS